MPDYRASLTGQTIKVMFRFWLGDIVYHRLAREPFPGMITSLFINPDGWGYFVTWQDRHETKHYECELTREFVPDYAREVDS